MFWIIYIKYFIVYSLSFDDIPRSNNLLLASSQYTDTFKSLFS